MVSISTIEPVRIYRKTLFTMRHSRIMIYLLFCLLITAACVHHPAIEKPPVYARHKRIHEFRRGMWVRAASTASPDSISRIMQIAGQMKITDIFVQVVVGGYAYYNSELLPRSQYLSKISDPDYDPLDSLIRACASTHIRVHAWVNTLLYWSLPEPPDSLSHVLYQHPEWFIRDVNNRSMADYPYRKWKNLRLEGLYLDPENPQVVTFVQSVCTEIASRYPVDGIHLDFIRYPGVLWGLPAIDETAVLAGIEAETASWCNLIQYGRMRLYQRWQFWNAWRLTQGRQYMIARIVSGINNALKEKAINEDCRLSAAAFANPALYKYSFAQNWAEWPAEMFMPVIMSYTPDTSLFRDYVDYALFHRPDALIGIGFLWPGMAYISQMQEQLVIEAGGRGVCYFDFAAIDTTVDLLAGQTGSVSEVNESLLNQSTRNDPVPDAYEDEPPAFLVTGGTNSYTWNRALYFAAFLLSLSMNPDRDLGRVGIGRDQFLHLVCNDVAAFEYLNSKIFPLGDELLRPPTRSISYSFIPWSDGDSLSLIQRASEMSAYVNDTILYPFAADVLARAAFTALPRTKEVIHTPAGIYAFTVDTVYDGGEKISRFGLSPDLQPVYLNWTIKSRFGEIIENAQQLGE